MFINRVYKDVVYADIDLTLDKKLLNEEVAKNNLSTTELIPYLTSQFSKAPTILGEDSLLSGSSVLDFAEILQPSCQ